MKNTFDVIIMGAGPGGYVAAIKLAQLGKKVAIVEKDNLGGVCLNWGCIPTKSLLQSAKIIKLIKNAKNHGIEINDYKIDIKAMVAKSRNVSKNLASGIELLLKKNNVQIYKGFGSIDKNHNILVSSDGDVVQILEAKKIIIATGARLREIEGFNTDGKLIINASDAMIPDSIPKSIIIVGSGAIGIEFASFYNTIGVDVTVIEAQDRILNAEDKEISEIAHKLFTKQGIKFYTKAKLINHVKNQNSITLNIEHEGKKIELSADKMLIAVGILGNVENIGLENTKIKVENTHIVTNQFMQTNEPNIYAIGDVVAAPWLAHKASHEGMIAAEAICDIKAHVIDKTKIPSCTYSYPQIASVGLTEEKAKNLGYEIKVGKFPFVANGKAITIDDKDGLIKTIFDAKTGELLGAHMIGSDVTELIQGYVIARNLEATEIEIMNTIFPHPTLSEMMHESVLSAYNKAIHI